MLTFVLSRRDFREVDQIITFYTKEAGKLEVLARGIKKITSKNSAHLEPFSCVETEIIPGKELSHLGAVQPINYFVNIRQDLQKSLVAGYVVDLLSKVLHEGEADVQIFELLNNFLVFLDSKNVVDYLKLVDVFVLRLLEYLGYDVSKNKDLNHKKIYEFLVYYTERKIEDWQGLTKI